MRTRPTTGATALTAGHSRAMASQSSGVSFMLLPAPLLMPLALLLPGKIIRLLAPIELICFWIIALEPLPTSIMAMTAPTPITIPSVVSTARNTLRRRAMIAVLKVRMLRIRVVRS
ncbi:MAG: hypothetical protein QM754_20140 [Tepidisphaeraceae bacterium]